MVQVETISQDIMSFKSTFIIDVTLLDIWKRSFKRVKVLSVNPFKVKIET